MSRKPSTQRKTAKAASPLDVHHKIGQLTRQLHDTLTELGLAEKLKGTVGELPDVKSRLHYIARLTGEAADFRVHGNAGAAYAYLQSAVGGLKHYGGGLFHIDNGPRRSF